MEYEGKLDEETEALGAELESLLQGYLGINMVFILPEKFRATEGQESILEGDVLSWESFECRLAKVKKVPKQQTSIAKVGRTAMKLATEQLFFFESTKEMANHLRPLFITANFGVVPLLPHRLLIKQGRTKKDLIPTHLTVTNFAGGITKTHGILDVDVIVGTKKLKIAFFVVDTTFTTYNALLAEIGSTRVCVFFPLYTSSWPSGMKTVLWKLWRPTHTQKLIEEGLSSSLEDWNRPYVLNLQKKKLSMHNPAINMAEFMHESTEEHEGNLQEEELEFAPAALDDSLPEVEDPLQEINLGTEEDPRPTFISTLLEEPIKSEIISLLHDFKDYFAWHYHEIPGLDKGLVEHKLPIKKGYLPVKQARRRMSTERLVKAGFIRPVIYADWLSNIVPLLKRKTVAVRICVDYRNLIKYMLTRPMLRGRIGKWTLALSEFAFRYVPHKSIKRQANADFLADHQGEEIEDMDSIDITNLDFQCTNNKAEYEALIIRLEMLVELGIQSVEILGDSMLVLKPIDGEYRYLSPSLAVYLVVARNLLARFREATSEHISREENFAANEMAQIATGV
ncbi:unnamed protein product [Prunus armeniaca]